MGLTKRVHAKRHPKMELPLQKCAWNQGSNMPNQPHADSPEPDGIFDLVAAWKAWALLIRKEQCILQPTSNLLSTKQATFNAGLVHGMARPHLTIYTRGLCPKNAPRYLHFFGLANQISVHGPCCFWGSCRGHCWPSLRRIDWNTTPPHFLKHVRLQSGATHLLPAYIRSLQGITSTKPPTFKVASLLRTSKGLPNSRRRLIHCKKPIFKVRRRTQSVVAPKMSHEIKTLKSWFFHLKVCHAR